MKLCSQSGCAVSALSSLFSILLKPVRQASVSHKAHLMWQFTSKIIKIYCLAIEAIIFFIIELKPLSGKVLLFQNEYYLVNKI